MLFNSYVYILAFLPITVAVFFLAHRFASRRVANLWLLGASVFFYSWWNVAYTPIIIGSVVFNYFLARSIVSNRDRRSLLFRLGVAANLALLGYYKFFDFIAFNINSLLSTDIAYLHLELPLAISFFTFQQISFLADCADDKIPMQSFQDYFLFVSFFPQLIAGPVVVQSEMHPQFEGGATSPRLDNISKGLFIFAAGLFKKVILADSLNGIVAAGFDQSAVLSFFEAWFVSLCYTFQLYLDFSGYCDMAVGSSLFFNILLPANFLSPYKSLSIQEFWRRWHITLGRFLRDRIYIPLGGSRGTAGRTYGNLMVTFLLAGLWHGAGWTFVAWGGIHGLALVVNRWWKGAGRALPKVLAWLVTFLFVDAAWVLFRAQSFADAWKVYKGMLGLSGVRFPNALAPIRNFVALPNAAWCDPFLNIGTDSPTVLACSAIFIAVMLVRNNSYEAALAFLPKYRTALISGVFFAVGLLSLNKVSVFLYFNF